MTLMAVCSHDQVMDCSPVDSSVHGILKARLLVWVTIPCSTGSSQPRDRTWVSCIAADSLPSEPTGKPQDYLLSSICRGVPSVSPENLWSRGKAHTAHGACWNSSPSSQWCHPTISSSVVPFSSSCLNHSQGLSGSFQMSPLFATGAKVLELQLQHQSFQWIFRPNFP